MKIPPLVENLSARSVKHVEPTSRRAAVGLTARVYEQAERDFGIVPPLALHSPSPPVLAGIWILLREAFVVGREGRGRREAIAAAVSELNECPFCVEVHSAMLHATRDHGLASKFAKGKAGKIEDGLVAWALATLSPGAPILALPPFSSEEADQYMATALAYHFLNRMVNVFLEPSPSPIALGSGTAKDLLARLVAASIGKRLVAVAAVPGEALSLLPEAPLPDEFAWASGDRLLAGALARFAAAIELAAKDSVPTAARAVVQDFMADWHGKDPGLSLGWLDNATASLQTEGERAAARLALLTAVASYRVDETHIAAFRKCFSDDAHLIACSAWGALVATKRIGSWITKNPSSERVNELETPG